MKKLLLLTTILICFSFYKVNKFSTSDRNAKNVKSVNGSYPEQTNEEMSKSQNFRTIGI